MQTQSPAIRDTELKIQKMNNSEGMHFNYLSILAPSRIIGCSIDVINHHIEFYKIYS